MSDKTDRKALPRSRRQDLLNVVGEIILQKGVAAVTLESVAEAAGVSKGGLLYHFPNKKDLLAGFAEHVAHKYMDSVRSIAAADTESVGRNTRADLNIYANSKDSQGIYLWAALLATRHDNGGFDSFVREHFFGIMSEDSDGTDTNVMLAIVKFAVDGLAIAEMAGVFQQDPGLRLRVIETLQAITFNPKHIVEKLQ